MNRSMIKTSILSLVLLSNCLAFGGESENVPFDFASLPADLKQVVVFKMDPESFSAMKLVNKEMNSKIVGSTSLYSLNLLAQKKDALTMMKLCKRKLDDAFAKAANISPEQQKKLRILNMQYSSGQYNLHSAQDSHENHDYRNAISFASRILKDGYEEPMLLEK